MITSLSVDNYRCFEHLALSGLKRVTVITGSSGSGKTALLEALLIAAKGQPDAVIRANRTRALPEAPPFFQGGVSLLPLFMQAASGAPMTPVAFQASWASMFNNPAKPIGIVFRDSDSIERSLYVAFGAGESTPQLALTLQESGSPKTVTFDRMKGSVQESPIVVSLNQNNQMVYSRSAEEFGPTIFHFPSTAQFNENDNVNWFSDLIVQQKSKKVIEMISNDFPFVKDLQVISPAGAIGIYATLSDGHVRPLSLVSSGIHKMFSLYCGISDLTDGVILLDEIENGIYYERYESLWRNLYQTASETHNQLFVTVHSAECLRALLPALESNVSDFCLLRTEREDSHCVVRQISGQAMRAALHGEVDLRGTANAA